jgi:hypothetical protein
MRVDILSALSASTFTARRQMPRANARDFLRKRLKCLVEFFGTRGTGDFGRDLFTRNIVVDNFTSAMKSPADGIYGGRLCASANQCDDSGVTAAPCPPASRFVAAAHGSVPYFLAIRRWRERAT